MISKFLFHTFLISLWVTVLPEFYDKYDTVMSSLSISTIISLFVCLLACLSPSLCLSISVFAFRFLCLSAHVSVSLSIFYTQNKMKLLWKPDFPSISLSWKADIIRISTCSEEPRIKRFLSLESMRT